MISTAYKPKREHAWTIWHQIIFADKIKMEKGHETC